MAAVKSRSLLDRAARARWDKFDQPGKCNAAFPAVTGG